MFVRSYRRIYLQFRHTNNIMLPVAYGTVQDIKNILPIHVRTGTYRLTFVYKKCIRSVPFIKKILFVRITTQHENKQLASHNELVSIIPVFSFSIVPILMKTNYFVYIHHLTMSLKKRNDCNSNAILYFGDYLTQIEGLNYYLFQSTKTKQK